MCLCVGVLILPCTDDEQDTGAVSFRQLALYCVETGQWQFFGEFFFKFKLRILSVKFIHSLVETSQPLTYYTNLSI